MSKPVNFRKSEVISYLEEKILDGTANDDESELYENFKWFGEIERKSSGYKKLIREMMDIFENGYE